MNRRSFLKLTGVTAVVALAPKVFASEPKCEWIKFTDRMPEDLDKIAVFTYFKGGNVNILTGTVIANNHAEWLLDSVRDRFHGCYPDDVKVIRTAISYSPDGFFGRDVDVRVYDTVETQGLQEEINRAKWISGKRFKRDDTGCLAPRHGRKRSEYVGRNESYWFPIDKYIPENLPEFPKEEKANLVWEDNKCILVKD